MKKRLSVTLDEKVVEQIKASAIKNNRNFSQELEMLATLYLHQKELETK